MKFRPLGDRVVVRRLKEDQRTILVLHFYGGVSQWRRSLKSS